MALIITICVLAVLLFVGGIASFLIIGQSRLMAKQSEQKLAHTEMELRSRTQELRQTRDELVQMKQKIASFQDEHDVTLVELKDAKRYIAKLEEITNFSPKNSSR